MMITVALQVEGVPVLVPKQCIGMRKSKLVAITALNTTQFGKTANSSNRSLIAKVLSTKTNKRVIALIK